jgi:energy-coupling factor transporter ATP-binding protein EcfA2
LCIIHNTGSGKSTIVNWLNNADYECEKTEFGYELKLKDEKNYSKIGKGTASITKKPEYHFNEEN